MKNIPPFNPFYLIILVWCSVFVICIFLSPGKLSLVCYFYLEYFDLFCIYLVPYLPRHLSFISSFWIYIIFTVILYFCVNPSASYQCITLLIKCYLLCLRDWPVIEPLPALVHDLLNKASLRCFWESRRSLWQDYLYYHYFSLAYSKYIKMFPQAIST